MKMAKSMSWKKKEKYVKMSSAYFFYTACKRYRSKQIIVRMKYKEKLKRG